MPRRPSSAPQSRPCGMRRTDGSFAGQQTLSAGSRATKSGAVVAINPQPPNPWTCGPSQICQHVTLS